MRCVAFVHVITKEKNIRLSKMIFRYVTEERIASNASVHNPKRVLPLTRVNKKTFVFKEGKKQTNQTLLCDCVAS